jgi:ADP-ribosylglycohydrolase
MTESSLPGRTEKIAGCLFGTAVGDALGLWCEGMSRRRLARFGKPLDRFHFLFGRGMVSDDTEHAVMVAQALIVSAGAEQRFLCSLAWRLRWWLLGLPAGAGKATLRACVRLWLGFSPRTSGVFSAGNGPAMRSPLLGICFGHDRAKLLALVRASTRMTHTDPKAEQGALAIALAAHLATSETADLGERFLTEARALLDDATLLELLDKAVLSATRGEATHAYADSMGLTKGVSGTMYHTVPVVIQAWLRHGGDYREAVTAVIRCGGDTDSTAAILGGIVGAASGVPDDLRAGLCEWPRTNAWIERLSRRLAGVLADGKPGQPLRLFLPGVLLRNVVFLSVVLAHGLRRCLPPY